MIEAMRVLISPVYLARYLYIGHESMNKRIGFPSSDFQTTVMDPIVTPLYIIHFLPSIISPTAVWRFRNEIGIDDMVLKDMWAPYSRECTHCTVRKCTPVH